MLQLLSDKYNVSINEILSGERLADGEPYKAMFKDVGEVPEYTFSVPVLFITLVAFIVLYEALMLFYAFKINKVTVKTVMLEKLFS